jgi:hypothetical protein
MLAARPFVGSSGASGSRLLAPDFCCVDERSRNLIDEEGRPDLSRSKTAKGAMIEAASHLPGESNGYNRKSTGYTGGAGENPYQAGMYKGMNGVQSYVPVTSCQSEISERAGAGKVGNTRTRPECAKE